MLDQVAEVVRDSVAEALGVSLAEKKGSGGRGSKTQRERVYKDVVVGDRLGGFGG